ncbi:MAG: hypothetical protein MJ084_05445 [Saccharofermentans sp.]|nr:hypothetical protein [Saccharofermentans sp.]
MNNFDVGAQDEALNEVLSAKKTNLTYNNGSIIPDENLLIEDEPLVIEPEIEVVSYEDVQERSAQYAIEHEDPQTRLENKRKSRKLTGRKLFETVVSIILVILMGCFVMLLLYPQTELSELARDNSNLKDQINTTKREIVNAEENANGIADMDVVRAQAIALGMQDPNQNQLINLPVPNTDTLRTRASYNTEGINNEAFNDSKDALADYYAANPDK